MAVLRVFPAADEAFFDALAEDPAAREASSPGFVTVRTLLALTTGPLPEDVRDEEYTVVALFRASLVLNFLTGGAPDMTFSARCHASRRTSRAVPQRLLWHLIASAVDTACGVLRGEHAHCAVAWTNHIARTDPSD